MTFTLPLPPSANRYWAVWRNRAVLTPEARAYKRDAGREARLQGVQPLLGRVGVRLHIYRRQKSGDLDNFAKVTLDAMNGVAWNDDGQLVELHLYRRDDAGNPRVEVAIWSVAPAQVQEALL
jgi:crossover junction endodeoxyribonuclease RusA